MKNEKPLISLIVRTMNRPELPEALGCIARQTYPNIEIIIIDATGENILNVDKLCGKFPFHIVSKNKHLNIPEAANTGLDEVKGEFFGFLDEDDLIDETHIDDLYQVLYNSNYVAAYSNINMVDMHGNFMHFYGEEYQYEKLLFGNFIPNHALLFRADVLEKGCRSDESLIIYDDWDFLLQVAQHGELLHLNKNSGTYRNFLTSGVHHNKKLIAAYRKNIFIKWRNKISPDLYYSFINSIGALKGQQEVDELKQSIIKFEKMYAEEKQNNQQLTLDLDKALNTIKSIEESKSWRITTPFRKIMELIGS